MDEINNKINSITSINDLSNEDLTKEIKEEIKKLPTVEDKIAASELYVQKAKSILIEQTLTKEQLESWINEIREDLSFTELSSETIDEIFSRNNFSIDEMIEVEQEEKDVDPEKPEIEQIEEEIKKGVNPEPKQPVSAPVHPKKEIERMTEYIHKYTPEGITTIEQIEEEIKRLEKEKSEKMKAIDAEIAKLSTGHSSIPEGSSSDSSSSEESSSSAEVDYLENELANVKEKKTTLWNSLAGDEATEDEEKELQELDEKEKLLNELLSNPEKIYQNLDSKIIDIETELFAIDQKSKTDEELSNDLLALYNKLNFFGVGHIEQIERNALEKRVNLIKEEQERRKDNVFYDKTNEELEHLLEQQVNLLNLAKQSLDEEEKNIVSLSDEEKKAIQKEQERRNNLSGIELTDVEQSLETLESQKNDIQNRLPNAENNIVEKSHLEKQLKDVEKRIAEDRKKRIELICSNKTPEEIEVLLEELNEKSKKCELVSEKNKLDDDIKLITKYKKDKYHFMSTEELNELLKSQEKKSKSEDMTNNISLIQKRIDEIKKEIDERKNDTKLKAELQQKLHDLQQLKDNLKKAPKASKVEDNSEEKDDNKEKISELEKEKTKIQSDYDGKIQKLNNVKLLMEIRDAYLQIQNDAIASLEEEKIKEETLIGRIKETIEKHEKFPILDKYKNIGGNTTKLKNELVNDIANRLRTKKPEKPKQDKKLLWKGLAGVAGFVTGFGLTAFPGIGTIRMVAAGTKLAVNLWTKNFPEGKVAKFISNIDEKLEKSESGFMQKINAVKNFLKNPYVNYFTNGLSAGYLAGNAFEFFTGRTWAEYFGLKDNPIGMIVDPVDKVPVRTPLELQPGQELDLSSLGQGYSYEGALDSHSILEYAGEQAKFDRMVEVDGQRWYHFLQGANAKEGAGYSWFTEEQIQQAIDAAKAAGKGR